MDDRLLVSIDLAPTMLAIAGAGKPPKMQGEVFLGDRAGSPREYAFGARDRCDETVFRFRTVRDERYRYIRNFTPDRPFLQPNDYKERQYPVWTLLQELRARGQAHAGAGGLGRADDARGGAVRHQERSARDEEPGQLSGARGRARRMRGVLARWIEESNDQGRELEPEDLAARKGVTRPDTNPNKGYDLDGNPSGGGKAKAKQ